MDPTTGQKGSQCENQRSGIGPACTGHTDTAILFPCGGGDIPSKSVRGTGVASGRSALPRRLVTSPERRPVRPPSWCSRMEGPRSKHFGKYPRKGQGRHKTFLRPCCTFSRVLQSGRRRGALACSVSGPARSLRSLPGLAACSAEAMALPHVVRAEGGSGCARRLATGWAAECLWTFEAPRAGAPHTRGVAFTNSTLVRWGPLVSVKTVTSVSHQKQKAGVGFPEVCEPLCGRLGQV